MKLKAFFFFSVYCVVLLSWTSAQALESKPQFEFQRLFRIEYGSDKFKNTTLGGISAAFFKDGELFLLSDDRGQVNPPRFYVASIQFPGKFKFNRPKIQIQEVVNLHAHSESQDIYVDGEGFQPLAEDRFLISCEGDNNHKPRRPPRLFVVNRKGELISDWPIPTEASPELTGMQTRGIQNNSGFEGLTLSEGGPQVLAATERPWVQDLLKFPTQSYVRFLLYGNKLEPVVSKNFLYPLEMRAGELLNGVSEVLSLQKNAYLVLERSVLAELGSRIRFRSRLFGVQLDDVNEKDKENFLKKWEISQSSVLSNKPARVAPVFSKDDTENFEAMAWGPAWKEFPRTLWIFNDNNFSKKEPNVALVFGVREKVK